MIGVGILDILWQETTSIRKVSLNELEWEWISPIRKTRILGSNVLNTSFGVNTTLDIQTELERSRTSMPVVQRSTASAVSTCLAKFISRDVELTRGNPPLSQIALLCCGAIPFTVFFPIILILG